MGSTIWWGSKARCGLAPIFAFQVMGFFLGAGLVDHRAMAMDGDDPASPGKALSPGEAEGGDDPIEACQALLDEGIAHEEGGRYPEARNLYRRAVEMCPQEPVPRRFLAELYRFYTGEWALAEEQFRAILEVTADGEDDFSRAVALQGLGKLEL